MIGRRGRLITLGAAGCYHPDSTIAVDPSPKFATLFLQDNLFDAVVASWMCWAIGAIAMQNGNG